MRKRLVVCLITSLTIGATVFAARQSTPVRPKAPVQVHVDVIVHDKAGSPIPGLTRDDFEIREYYGGSRNTQKIATVMFERPLLDAMPPLTWPLLNPAGMTTKDLAGRRAWVLVFDTSALDRAGLQRVAKAASAWLTEKMTSADLVGIASIDAGLTPLLDLTNDKPRVLAALDALALNGAPMTEDASAPEYDGFNNDARLRGITSICNSLVQPDQRKALVYFSARRERNGPDNQIVVRSTERACQQAHVLVSSIDARPVDAATAVIQPSGGGTVQMQLGSLGQPTSPASISTLLTTFEMLASTTDGAAGTGDKAVSQVLDAALTSTSSYYILGYASTRADKGDGYRQINVRLKNNSLDYKIDRPYAAYWAASAGAHDAQPAKGDREQQLREQLRSPTPAMDLPFLVTTGAFRLASRTLNLHVGGPVSVPPPDPFNHMWSSFDMTSFPAPDSPLDDHKFYVPISIELPPTLIAAGSVAQTFDVRVCLIGGRDLCALNDRRESSLIKDTITVPPASGQQAHAPVRYETGIVMTSGHTLLRVAVRDDATGRMGLFQVYLVVPNPMAAPLHLSSVVLSTESRPAPSKSKDDLLSHDGVELLRNVSGIVRQDQTLHVYYEVYDPSGGAAPKVTTHVAFYRGTEKVFDTPTIERTTLDDTARHAAVFNVDIPASSLAPGSYVCEITIADDLARTSARRRLDVYIHPK